jgi:hypothetical protein
MAQPDPPKGRYTFFAIDVDKGVVVGIWKSDDPVPSSATIREATQLIRETRHRLAITRAIIELDGTK